MNHTAFYDEYIQSPEWQAKREKVLIFWSGRCALCNSPRMVEVHHRTYERLGHELLTDLIPLCDTCHERHHEFMRFGGPEHISVVLHRVAEHVTLGA